MKDLHGGFAMRRMISARRRVVVARAFLGMGAAAATSVILVAQLGRTHHTLDQFNSLLALLVPALGLILAFALRMRDRAAAIVAGIGLLVGGYQLGGAALAGRGRSADDQGPSLKIMTLSTYHSNQTPEAIPAVIAAEAPDIVLLQETNGTAATVVDGLLPGFHRARSCKKQRCTLTILSRWPLRRTDLRHEGRRPALDGMAADVDAPFATFRIVNVHLHRPYEKNAQRAFHELAALLRADTALPTILGGDFNAATGSFGLARFAQESRLRRHDGFIPTYPANTIAFAFIGIDHVFADSRWARASCHRTGAGGSDHYGVACRMRLRATD